MKYTYRSTCRFNMLVQIGSEIVEIRPNQVIESETQLKYELLKDITKYPKPEPVIKPIAADLSSASTTTPTYNKKRRTRRK